MIVLAGKAAKQVRHPFTSASISASVGKRPAAALENFSAPSTVMSNTPPLPRTSSTSAPESLLSRALAPRAFGS